MEARRGLSPLQYERLMRPLNPSRVKTRDRMSYLEAWDVRAHLIRVFGYGGFSVTADEAEMVSQREVPQSKDKTKMNQEVCWKVRVTLVIPQLEAVYSEYAIGSSSQPSLPEAHDMAIKTAESDALKRCAINLGTQFGLSLYADGALQDVVVGTLVREWRAFADEEQARHTPEEAAIALNQAPPQVDQETGEVLEASHTVRDASTEEGVAWFLERLRTLSTEVDNSARIMGVAGLKQECAGHLPLDLTVPYKDGQITLARLADLVAQGQYVSDPGHGHGDVQSGDEPGEPGVDFPDMGDSAHEFAAAQAQIAAAKPKRTRKAAQ